MLYPPSIQKLIDKFSKFPTVGPRTAARFVFYLMKLSREEIEEIVRSISTLKEKIKLCSFCFNPFEPASPSQDGGEEILCKICQSPRRDKTLLCVVEKESDLLSLEKAKKYNGLFFILGGQKSIKQLRIKELETRVKNPGKFGIEGASFKEVIIATNPTTEGETTALYLERLFKPLNIKITRLGRGLPVGGELEYADEETLASALEGRK